MKVDIWMPIYIGDYISDTLDLTTEEHGIYLLLIMHYWKKGKLTTDIDKLLNVTRLSKDKKSILQNILSTYFINGDGYFIQNRIEKELEKANNRRESAIENGKKGGRPKGSKNPEKSYGLSDDNPQETHGLSEGKPTGKLRGNPRESSLPLPSSLPTSSSTPSKKKDARYGIEDIIKMFDAWNKQDLPKYPEGLYKTGVNIKDSGEILNYLKSFNKIEISQAIRNYAKIRQSSEHELKPEYGDALGFFRAGIHKYYEDADPFKRCLKSGKIEKKKIDDKRQKNRPTHCKQCSIEINDKNTKISTTIMQCRECKTRYKWNGHEWIIDK